MSNLDTLLLTYREYANGIATIDEHSSIIKEKGFVYWGWWKKTFEDLPCINASDFFPCDIWLCDRNSRLFHKAKCENAVFFNEKRPSPSIDHTPHYYNYKPLSGWLKLTDIQRVSETEYFDLYGEIPTDENTLYLLNEKTKETQRAMRHPKTIKEGLFIPQQPITARGDTILHISDLHFGIYHNYYNDASVSSAQSFLDEDLLPVFKELIPEMEIPNIGIIVASGDFVSKNDASSFVSAVDFLVKLCRYLNLERTTHLIIVPGNHDISFDRSDPNPFIENSFKDNYYIFRKALLGIDPGKNIESLNSYYFPKTRKYVNFACFNSSEICDESLKDFGHIDKKQYHILAPFPKGPRKQLEYLRNKCLNFCVIHHHLLYPLAESFLNNAKIISTFPESSFLVQRLSTIGFHVLLHGHLHIPVTGQYSIYSPINSNGERLSSNSQRNSLYILGAGSAGGNTPVMYEECPYNSFNTYKLSDELNGFHVTEYYYGKSIESPKIRNTNIGRYTRKRIINLAHKLHKFV